MVACTILFISVFAISQLMDTAGQQANLVRERSLGMQLAQSKLKELEAGALPLTSGGGTFDEAPEWSWTLDANQNEITNLWNVTIQVQRQNSDTAVATLSQFILDPSVRGNSTDIATITSSSSSSSSTDPNAGQSGSSTPTPTPAAGGAASGGGAPSKPAGGASAPAGGGTSKPAGGTGAPAGGSGGTGKTGGTSPPSGGSSKPAAGGTGGK